MLLILVLVANALWNVLFFRWQDLRASFVAFIPYAVVVAALVAVLFRVYPFGAALFACYCMYLIYATWSVYNLWRLNTSTPNSTL
jgi:TspO/MBR family.